jgi:FlaA1/EpsC-like NDP-sugar epimerase
MTQSLFLRRYSNRFLSRWLVLAIDMGIVAFSFSAATMLRMNFHYADIDFDLFRFHFLLLIVVRASSFYYFQSYSGIIRHTSIEDALLILKAVFSGTFILSKREISKFELFAVNKFTNSCDLSIFLIISLI